MDDAERAHLLARNADLDRARRRWKVLALAATPALVVIALLALANAVATSLTLKDRVERERRKAEEDREQIEAALRQADQVLEKEAQGEAVQAYRRAVEALQRDEHSGRPLSLALEVIEPDVKAGATPKFRLTVTNTAKGPEKVLDIRTRHDLQHTYYDLEVSKDGKPVTLPRAISDPGPVTAEDLLTLAPGNSVTFVLKQFPTPLKDLPPGTYQASVRFWQDPMRGRETSYKSPEVTFNVRK